MIDGGGRFMLSFFFEGHTWMTGEKAGEFAILTVTTSPFVRSMPGRGEVMEVKNVV